MDDDFEIIDVPAAQATTDLPIRTKVDDQRFSGSEVEISMNHLVDAMQTTADEVSKNKVLFFADLGPDKDLIYNTWREGVPEKDRGVLKCSACRQFLRSYANLCIITSMGVLKPLFWSPESPKLLPYFKRSIINIAKLFEGKTVTKEFKVKSLSERTLGNRNSAWVHMSITLTVPLSAKHAIIAPQDIETLYTMLCRAIDENSAAVIAKVHYMITEDQLPYATSHKAAISYFNDLAKKLAEKDLKDISRRNLITRYACDAFPGCISSLRGGMLGYLLECVRKGEDFQTIQRGWELKANPLSYLRPTAAPSTGNVQDAERILEKLGYKAYDLERVYLTLDQVPKNGILWSPAAVSKPADSSDKATDPIFGKLLNFPGSQVKDKMTEWDTPTVEISFRRFAERILPNVASMELDVAPRLFMYFLTNGKKNSKPLMSFHSETNTASWYVWGSERSPVHAGLTIGWTKISSIITLPHMWEEAPLNFLIDEKADAFKHKRHGIRYLFCLEGAKAGKPEHLCLFPTLMKSEFHGIRKTVEAFSQAGQIEFLAEGKDYIGGVVISKKRTGKGEVLVRVKTHTGQLSKYKIVIFD